MKMAPIFCQPPVTVILTQVRGPVDVVLLLSMAGDQGHRKLKGCCFVVVVMKATSILRGVRNLRTAEGQPRALWPLAS